MGVVVIVVGFQISLFLGAPWGDFTLWGKFPGKMPFSMRGVALVQALVLVFFALIVVSKAGIAFAFLQPLSSLGVWFVFGFFILGTVVNLFSPSSKERFVMAPLNMVSLASSLMVAIG